MQKRFRAAVTAIAVGSSLAAAQDPLAAHESLAAKAASARNWTEVRVLLQADDRASAAWGAYRVGQLKLREAVPDLERVLRTLADPKDLPAKIGAPAADDDSKESTERLACARAALDALVQLEAKLPADALERWWSRAPQLRAQVLILASRDAKASAPFLSRLLAQLLDDDEWQAVCNLLLTAEPEALARQLAAELHIRIEVLVHEPGGVYGSFRSSGGSGIVRVPERFPPIVEYWIVDHTARGSVTFAPGPDPIGYLRTERTAHGWFISCGRCAGAGWDHDFDRNDYRLRCLADVLGTNPEELGLHGTVHIDHGWRDASAYLDEVGKPIGEVRERLQALLDRLAARGLFRADAALPITSRLDVAIDDRREPGAPELPALRD